MAFGYWQITYVLAVLIGLLIGWVSNPWFGAAFIWIVVITVEALVFRKRKRSKKAVETQGTPKA